MKQFNATDMDTAFVQCAVCEKAITGGKWYARIKHGEHMVALCCPLCTEVFETNPQPYIRRIETLAWCAARSNAHESASVFVASVVSR